MKISNVFKISQIRLRTADVAALETLRLIIRKLVNVLYRAFYFASFLVRKQDRHNVRICLKLTTELPALKRLKNQCKMFS